MFKVRVGVILFDQHRRLLLVRQNNRPFWVLPGGTLEAGETMEDCAVREIKEEANLDIVLGPLLYVSDFFAPNGRQSIDIIFSGSVTGGTLEKETSENINDIGFFSRAEVADRLCKPEALFERILTYWDIQETLSGSYLGHFSAD